MSKPDEIIELPDSLAEYLREKGEDEATVVIPAAEGWRYSSADIDLASEAARKRSHKLTEKGIERVEAGELSPGEELFLRRAAAEETY